MATRKKAKPKARKKAAKKPKPRTKPAKKKALKVEAAPTEDNLWISYDDLDQVTLAPRNPKLHDVGLLTQSFDRFGFVEPPTRNETTGRLVAGHGRIKALLAKKRSGDPPPDKIKVDSSGNWFIPVVRGNAFDTDMEAEAYLFTSNRSQQIGGMDDAGLLEMLKDHAELNDGLLGTGYDLDDLDFYQNRLNESLSDLGDGGGEGEGLSENYSRKIKAPIYEPKGDRPPEHELFDRTKTDKLKAEIHKQSLPEEIAGFLREAAERHTVFRFDRIAEYYCHATPEVQDLMERSALVIIDFDKAIECGFVSLATGMMEQAEIAKQEKADAEAAKSL